VISLRKSVNELDRLGNLQSAAVECYQMALRSVAQYALEVDPSEAAEFRENLDGLGREWQRAASPDELRSVQTSFRGELREYRDSTAERLAHLRSDLEASAKAMACFATDIAAHGADYRAETQGELKRLDRLTESDSLDEIRRGIHHATATIAASLELIEAKNKMMVAQLQDEIRTLHNQFQSERRALFTDVPSGAWNRQKVEIRIEELLRQNQPFCFLLINIRNLKRLESRHTRAVAEGTLKALVRRFQAMLGTEALIGRWSHGAFVAIVDPQHGGALPLSRQAIKALSGSYTVQEGGLSHETTLEVTAGTVDHGPGTEVAAFTKKLEQLSSVMEK